MEDIKIVEEKVNFKFRVCGVIKYKDKYLLQIAKSYDGYCFTGGHVEFGENTSNAMIREIKEELNVDVKIEKLLCINENIYVKNEKLYQEIAYYYLLTPYAELPDKDFSISEIDKGVKKVQNYTWLKLEQMEKVKPNFMQDILANNYEYPQIIATDDRIGLIN